jgi:hypothetical protein
VGVMDEDRVRVYLVREREGVRERENDENDKPKKGRAS